jgi:transposase
MQNCSFYPTSLTDTQWNLLAPLLPRPAKRGRKPKDRRLVLDAIFYMVRGGGAWRLLPKEFGPWSTVYDIFRGWTKTGIWQRIHDALRDLVRQAAGKSIQPSAAALDSQSVKAAEGGPTGFDAGKLIKGRKRHLLVDTLGLLLAVCVTPASVQDRDGAVELLSTTFMLYWRLAVIWADSIYGGNLIEWVKGLPPFGRLRLEVVQNTPARKASPSCPSAGSWNGLLVGWSNAAASAATMSGSPHIPRLSL